ncbi:MAG: hypothetical protein CTY24_01360 [Methylobacter sp.]|nr:MAG: hypothetical protein CTY24_01360 [Methylobacter sp.]
MAFFQTLSAPFNAYMQWLHLRWPAGTPEALPVVGQDGATSIPGLRIAGDLLGVPLLKFAADSGARAVQAFIAEHAFNDSQNSEILDLAIIGGGVAGLSAALEAQKAGLKFVVYEASEPFSTIVNFTNGKPIFTYPKAMQPAGDVELTATNKEELLAELRAQADKAQVLFENKRIDHVQRKSGELEICFTDKTPAVKAKRVLICTGRSGDYHKLNVPGEELEKVHNRLFDPKDYTSKKVLVVGGGDSALETAISLKQAGSVVQLSYRGAEFTRPKPENIQTAQRVLGDDILFESTVSRIEPDKVVLKTQQGEQDLPNEAVFVCLGREAPVDFFQRSGLEVHGLWTAKKIAGFALAFLTILFIYRWKKSNSEVSNWFYQQHWFPYNLDFSAWHETGSAVTKLLFEHLASPGFYYELAYCLVVLVFGIKRILRYKTPYIRWQTISLMSFQIIPLFLLPNFILPLLGQAGAFDSEAGAWLADQLFPLIPGTEIREYWRSVGFILAWPLFVWNVFTPTPNALWLAIAMFQTFVLIPWLVIRYGKGAYCGWICSCGALAETLGDAHRAKMPHGKFWNKLNMSGQVILAFAIALLILRITAWVLHGTSLGETIESMFNLGFTGLSLLGIPLNYATVVDYFLAGIIGLGLYFHFSGRTWCRFFCPLAALMHIYARFSRFRIFTEKEKCISCNACTAICHQGIDIMNFANKGAAMEDPECVRCSACVYTCPTGVLSFGRLGADGTIIPDSLPASPVLMRETAK